MSDINLAPDAGASASAPAHAPSAPETPIEPNPVSSPQPIGSQAPPKPVEDLAGSKHRPQSRREVIQAAFDKAQAAGRPEAAKARMGHNQPPEETKPEPQEKPQQQRREQPREGGRFVRAPSPGDQQSSQQQPGQQPGQQDQGQQRQPQAHRELPEGTPYRAPPPRFSERAKADWHAAPESVRGDIYRMHAEVDRMHQHYRADKAEMDQIRPFQAMAQQHGTTLQRALNNYVSMEQKLRQDPLAGLEIIVSNLNLKAADGRKLGFRDIAYYALNQSPEQHKLMQTQQASQTSQHQIGQLHQMISHLAQQQQAMQNERQHTYTRAAVDQFADAHPRFDELGDLIQQELQFGFSLEQAYQRAERLRPATHADQTRNTSAQTRSNKSISGAPAGPSNGTGRSRGDKPVERRDAIQNAIRRVNGSM